MIRLLTTRLQSYIFKLEINKIVYSIYDKVAYKTTDYKTTLTTINKKKINIQDLASCIYS